MANRLALGKIAHGDPTDAPLHLRSNAGRVPSRASGGRATILILSCALLAGAAPAGAAAHRALPMRAIVNGHNLQPRDNQLKALGFGDLTAKQADEVDRLYRQLMRSAPPATKIPS